MPTLSLLLPLGAYGALTAVGVDGGKAGLYRVLYRVSYVFTVQFLLLVVGCRWVLLPLVVDVVVLSVCSVKAILFCTVLPCKLPTLVQILRLDLTGTLQESAG